MKIGCIGQGWVGRNIADNFERRNYSVVRYALEPEYALNRRFLKDCDVVFIAVPTPTTPHGFDYSIVQEMVSLVGEGKIAVIKSTILPGTSKKIQDAHPNKVVLFSPEFLCESTAVYDVSHPMFNIIGLAYDSAGHRSAGEEVMRILPLSKHNFIVRAEAAELFKYAHNINGYIRVILGNLLHDVAENVNVDWADVKLIMDNDPMMSPYYNSPVHKGGRGAGGHCFIKDMAAFSRLFAELIPQDKLGIEVLRSLEKKNLELLAMSGKDQELVRGVYGEHAVPPTSSIT